MREKQMNLRINNVPLAASVDGHQLMTDNHSGVADLLFFQINPGSINDANADAIAAARVRLTLDQLKQLNADIVNAIEKYEHK